MDGEAASSHQSVGVNIIVSSSQISTPVVKAEAPEKNGEENPIIKKEPEESLMEEDEAPSEESELSASSMLNSSNDLPQGHLDMSALDSGVNPVTVSASQLDPWSAVVTVKQEPDIVIDRDDEDTVVPGSDLAPQVTSDNFKDPRPVMMVKSRRMNDESSNYSSDTSEEFLVDGENGAIPAKDKNNLWLRLLNEKATCLVCSGPCVITKNRKIPSLPFCKRCKKAYFYQLNHVGKGVRPKSDCCRGGNCLIDYRCPKGWCHVCHLNKFRSFLIKKGAFTAETLRQKEMELSGKKIASDTNNYDSSETTVNGQKRPGSELIDKDLVVKLRKLTSEDLEPYGVSLPEEGVTVKQEPLDICWHNRSNRFGISTAYQLPPISATTLSHFASSQLSTFQVTAASQSQEMPKVQKSPKPKFVPRIAMTSKAKRRTKPQPKTAQGSQDIRNPIGQTNPLASLKVYVFTCGHACSVCNTSRAKEWLTKSGFHSRSPVIESGLSSTRLPHPSPILARNKDNPLGSTNPSADHTKLKQLLERPPGVRLNIPVPPVQRNVIANTNAAAEQQFPFLPRAVSFRQKVPDKATAVSSVPETIQALPLSLPASLPSLNGPVHLLRVSSLPQNVLSQTGDRFRLPISSPIAHGPGTIHLNTVSPGPPIPAIIATGNVSLPSADNLARLAPIPSVGFNLPSVTLQRPISVLPGNIQVRPIVPFSFIPGKCVATSCASSPLPLPAGALATPTQVVSSTSLSDNTTLATPSGQLLFVPPEINTASSSSAKPFFFPHQIMSAAPASVSTAVKSSPSAISVLATAASDNCSGLVSSQVGSNSPSVTSKCPVTVNAVPVTDPSSGMSSATLVLKSFPHESDVPAVSNSSQKISEVTPVSNSSQKISEVTPVSNSPQKISEVTPVSISSQKISGVTHVFNSFQMISEVTPVSNSSQKISEVIPVSNSSQKISEVIPVSNSSQKISEVIPVSNSSEKMYDATPVSNSSQKISDMIPVSDSSAKMSNDAMFSNTPHVIITVTTNDAHVSGSSQKVSDETPVSDSSQKVSDETPVSDSSQKVSNDTSVLDAFQKVSDETPVSDSSQKVSNDTSVLDAFQKVSDETPVSGSSQKASDDTPVLDTFPKVSDETPVSDSSQKVSDDTPVLDAFPKVSDETPILDAFQKVSDETPVSDSSQMVSDETPVLNAFQKVSDETPVSDTSQKVSDETPLSDLSDVTPVSDSSSKMSKDTCFSNVSHVMPDGTPVLDASQQVSNETPALDASQKVSDETPVSDSLLKI